MSVASLTDPFHVINVADEIESFINVLLYNAVERLPHDCEDHMKEIMKYFLESLSDHGYRSCGEKKRDAIVRGVGITVKGEVVRFGAPGKPNEVLDGLLYSMFARFQARYSVLKYEGFFSPSENSKPRPADAESGKGNPPSQRRRVGDLLGTAGGNLLPGWKTRAPPDTTVALAKLLETHCATLRLFNVVVGAKEEWPQNEVLSNHSLKPPPEPVTDQQAGRSATISSSNHITHAEFTKSVPAYKPPREPARSQPPRRLGATTHELSLSEELMKVAALD